MEALVLSRSAASNTFILWCEDQGGLAILPLSSCGRVMPEVGDLLKVVLRERGAVRVCSSFTVIAPGALPEVGEMVRTLSAAPKVAKREDRRFLSLVTPV